MRSSVVSLALVVGLPSVAHAAGVSRAPFGTLPDGRLVEVITLRNAHGITARILSYGAILQALEAPDRAGKIADIVLGHDDLAGYLAKSSYFGATVGRYANRIAAGRFELDGKRYQLARNDGPNALHGGALGFDKRLWTVAAVTNGPPAQVTLRYTSPDGEEGYPGTLSVSITYSLGDDGGLAIDYRATTDRATIVNLTGHSYFNLGGASTGADVMGHRLTIPASRYTPVDATLIPTGEMRSVAGTPFDFRRATPIGARIRDGREAQLVLGHGYDHNFVLDGDRPDAPRLNARVEDPVSGRVLEVWSDQPGLQFYSGNFLDGTVVGKNGRVYRQGDALCLEPQLFPDTPNRPAFGSARLAPGAVYTSRIVYRLSTAPR